MQTVLSQMLEKYKINNIDDEKNALKEVIGKHYKGEVLWGKVLKLYKLF